MSSRLAFVCAVLFAVGGVLVFIQRHGSDAAAAGPFRMVVPGIAADSAPGAANPTPTPTPTPPPGPGSPEELWVKVDITVEALELAVGPSGTMPVNIFATAQGRMPSATDLPILVTGTFTISPHGTDAAGCTWTRTITKPDFELIIYHSTGLSVRADLEVPEWYYTLQCPKGPPVRVPAFGEETLFNFLLELMAPYRVGDGVLLPTPIYQGYANPPGCLKRSATFTGTTFKGTTTVDVYVYDKDWPGGCLLPLLN